MTVAATPPTPNASLSVPVRFGNFELQPIERRLLVDGQDAKLGSRAFDVLLALAAQPGRLLSKQQLLDQVWAGLVVEEGNLTTQVSSLRKVLGSDVIATIPGRGYRFTAPLDAFDIAATRTVAPAQAPLASTRLKTNLPLALTPLIGRHDDLKGLGDLIAEHRLVSLVGPGGIGKTLLAQHFLRQNEDRWRHGVCWVDLATVAEPASLPGSVATALGLQIGGGDALTGLCKAIEPLEVLVVLDNAEQLLDDVARVAAALHDTAPGLRLMTTSQAPLKLAPERIFRVDALAVPDGPLPLADALSFGAVALFCERARAADARFALSDNQVATVIDLCRALDGVPLAIELAAARAPMLGVQLLANSMNERLRLLTTGRHRDAPARQQTLRAAMEWSHRLLEERERVVFRRISVLAGSSELDLIQEVVADPDGEGPLDTWEVLEALSVLVDRSLVAVVAGSDSELPRYRLLESPRAFALEQLDAAGESRVLRRRAAQAVAALFDAFWGRRFEGDAGVEARAAASLDAARGSFAWALEHDEALTALRVAPLLLWTLPRSRERLQLGEQCEPLIASLIPAPNRMRVWLALTYSWAHAQPERAQTAAANALAVADELGDRFGRYFALARTAAIAARRHDEATADRAIVEMQQASDPHWPPQSRAVGADAQFLCASHFGRKRDAQAFARTVLQLERSWNPHAVFPLINLVDAELTSGETASAMEHAFEALATLQGSRQEFELAFVHINATAACLASGHVAEARRLAQAGWPRSLQFDLRPYWTPYLALIAALEARPRDAGLLLGHAQSSYQRLLESPQPNEAEALTRATALVRNALGEDGLSRALADGAALDDTRAAELAFAAAR